MASSHHNPRRRHLNSNNLSITSSLPSLHHVIQDHAAANLSLRKSSTFHSPTTPPSQDDDPIVNFLLLPRRAPTCPKALGDVVAAGEKRIQDIIGAVDRSLSGLETFSTDSQETLRAEGTPVPRFMLETRPDSLDRMDIDPSTTPSQRPIKEHSRRKHHSSDSGIGSTVTGSEESLSKVPAGMPSVCVFNPTAKSHVIVANTHNDQDAAIHPSIREIQSGINGTADPSMSEASSQHVLSEYACRHIQKHIISPIIAESSLKNFHPLVRGIPFRVGRKEITCLRDLEKVLLHLAPCLHTTVDFLSEPDQRRPTDRPYTNGYFLDLTEQVRQYAAMITASRARTANVKGMTDEDANAHGTLALHGGLSQTGQPAELVRIKDGQTISLRTGALIDSVSSPVGAKRSIDPEADEDPLRSMARRRKSAQAAVKEVQQCQDCDKVFKRPCDLTKHEKTHTRPWKCHEKSCKYHEYGWPTEKERDRHVNDKHSSSPSMYKCQYRPCPYESKRESNCKQHMEKAHGWAYVRSKNNGKSKKNQTGKTPPTPQITTPSFDSSSPEFGEMASPNTYGGAYSVAPSMNGSDGSLSHSALDTPYMDVDDRFAPFPANFSWNDSYDGYTPSGPSPYTPASHRLSIDAGSMTNAPTVPSSFESSMTPLDQAPLFTENFDWSNLNTDQDFTSLNIQLVTPASSVETRPLDAFSGNHSISLDQAPNQQAPSLSPGAQGNVMLYSPYSQNEGTVDEGYDDFSTEVGKPNGDFALFDGTNASSSMTSTGNQCMFQDLSTFVPNVWSGRGTDLAQQLGMNNLMDVDEE
ncbi:MAG: hypothetical protein L6R41_005834 [Letrouitia leprolyta]|nr:MAG: hypothetical protein L6R41_005834 [Letrouitia leprolyta]